MVQIHSAYSLSKETVTAIMLLYKNTKEMVHSPNRDTNFFDIIAGVLQEVTLAPYLFIMSPCLYSFIMSPCLYSFIMSTCLYLAIMSSISIMSSCSYLFQMSMVISIYNV